MTVWVLHCWDSVFRRVEEVSHHPTLEAATYAAFAWMIDERFLLPEVRSVYSIAEGDMTELPLL